MTELTMTSHFEIPPYLAVETKPKRYATEPDETVFKPQQEEGYAQMKKYLNGESDYNMFLLKGYAGTGKTFVVSRAVEWYLSTMRTKKVAVTAPTNKAVRVLYQSADYTHTNLEYLTVHKLLGLREKIDQRTGRQLFVQDKTAFMNCSLNDFDVLILDEVSMLNDDLFNLIWPYVKSGLKLIMMGDPAQIPPVNREECIPFTTEGQEEFGIQVYEMTEIVRQGAGNPIVETTMKIRNHLARPNMFPVRETEMLEDGSGVVFIQKANGDGGFLWDVMERYFGSKNFREDADFAKVIAWTNRTTDAMNRFVREMIYGRSVQDRIMKGEKLIANTPIFDRSEDRPTIIINTNDELEVIDYKVKEEDINGGQYTMKYYSTRVSHFDMDNNPKQSTIRILHNDSLEDYEAILKTLRAVAIAAPDGFKKGQAWEQFYTFMRSYADVKYNYAITAHKSQGSTYQNVFVMERDIDKNRKVIERNRIKYTACSRPARQLFIIN